MKSNDFQKYEDDDVVSSNTEDFEAVEVHGKNSKRGLRGNKHQDPNNSQSQLLADNKESVWNNEDYNDLPQQVAKASEDAEQPAGVNFINYAPASSSLNQSNNTHSNKQGENMVKKESFVSDDYDDGDNYVSLDSQLGRYDVNFKLKKTEQRNSEEFIAMQYNNSLEQGKDLNETDPKSHVDSSLDRCENSMSFKSVPMESVSSKAKTNPLNVIKPRDHNKNSGGQVAVISNVAFHSSERRKVNQYLAGQQQEAFNESISRSVSEGELSSSPNNNSKKGNNDGDQQFFDYHPPQVQAPGPRKQPIVEVNYEKKKKQSSDKDKSEEDGGSISARIQGQHNTLYNKKKVSKPMARGSLVQKIDDRVQRSKSILVNKDDGLVRETLQKQSEAMRKNNLSEDDDPENGFDMYQNQEQYEVSSSSDIETDTNDGVEQKKTDFFGLDNITMMYGGQKVNSKATCVIMPQVKWKLIWDFWVVFLLLVVSLLVPYRLAFDPVDTNFWISLYYAIDCNFVIDMVLTFFTVTTDQKTQELCTSKSKIAKQYFGFWFWIDLISVLPLDLLNSGAGANSLLRFAKIGKLYKLIRLSRLAKLFKLLKGQNAVFSQFSNSMQLSSGVERIVFIAIFSIFFFHISSCMFVFLAEFDEDPFDSWRYQEPYVHYLEFDLYITSVYYVVTTMSTVGYGDISGGTTLERIYCIILMLIGVIAFNLISGALGALITNYDSSQAALQEKLLFLNNLRTKYTITNELYFQIKKSLQYDHSLNMTGLDMFINELPANLRLEISEEIHRDNFSKMEWFRKIGNSNFRAWVASKLRPRFSTENTYMYQKGDNIDNFHFGVTGVFCFVIPDQKHIIYGVVDPSRANLQKARRKRVMQFFGCEDSIINTTALIHDRIQIDDCFKFNNNGLQGLHKRFFTVQCVTSTESLIFPFTEIDKMKRDFKMSTITFFQNMMQQTQKLLYFHNKAMEDLGSCQTLKIKRQRTEKIEHQRQQKQMITLEEENMQAVYEHIRNVPLNYSDFESIHFSENSSSYNTLNTSEINEVSPDGKVDDNQSGVKKGGSQAAECPYDEFNSKNSIDFDEKFSARGSNRGRRVSHIIKPSDMSDLFKRNITEPSLSNAFSSPNPSAQRRFSRMGTDPRNKLGGEDKNEIVQDQPRFMKSKTQFLIPDTLQVVSQKDNTSEIKQLQDTGCKKVSEMTVAEKGSSVFVRRNSTLSGQSGNCQKVDEKNDNQDKAEKQNRRKRKHKHKTYDKAARANFKQKMLEQLGASQGSLQSNTDNNTNFINPSLIQQMKSEQIDSRNTANGQQNFASEIIAAKGQLERSKTKNQDQLSFDDARKVTRRRSNSVGNKQTPRGDSADSQPHTKSNIENDLVVPDDSMSFDDPLLNSANNAVPQLDLENVESKGNKNLRKTSQRGKGRVIQIDDVEMISHSSEQRDKVPSLRENKVPLNKLHKEEGIMSELPFMNRIENAASPDKTQKISSKNDAMVPPQLVKRDSQSRKKPIKEWKKTSGRRHTNIKETELEFTRRLLAENPRGLKGLAYVLLQIQEAIAKGVIKPKISESAGKKHSGISKFAAQFNKAASTRLRRTEVVKELLNTLDEDKGRILDHLIKEQNFSNDESIIEKNEVFLEKILSNQETQLDSFFRKIKGRMDEMKNEIGTIKDRVQVLQDDSGPMPSRN